MTHPKGLLRTQEIRRQVVSVSRTAGNFKEMQSNKSLILRRLGSALENRAYSWEKLLAKKDEKSINLVIKAVGDACDMACSYCPTVRFDKSGRLDQSMIDRIITNELLEKYSSVEITWHGGEPLLAGVDFYIDAHKKIRKIAGDRKVSFYMQTNGLSLTSEWHGFMIEEGISVGISLDGPPQVHDKFRISKRGKPTYATILKNIKDASEAGVTIGILMVLPDDPRLYKMTEDFIRGWELTPVQVEIKYAKSGSLHSKEYGIWLGDLFRSWLRGEFSPHVSPILFESILSRITTGGGELCWIGGTCEKHIGVNPKGVVSPCCDRLVGNSIWALGHLGNDSLPTVVSGEKSSQFFSAASALHEDCVECEYRNVCNGGCVFYRIGAGGTKIGKDPTCPSYKLFFDACFDEISSQLSAALPT